MSRFKKGFLNAGSFSDFSNNSSELFDYTMTNIMDNFYDSATDHTTDGTFKAVVLSGMQSEDNSGGGTGAGAGMVQGKYVFLAVRPLNDMGKICPDPRQYKDPVMINDSIAMHSKVFLARSDFEFTVQSPITFGQIVNCYFEHGSLKSSSFQGLRFSEPVGVTVESSYVLLGTITGVETSRAAFVNGNVSIMGGFGGGVEDGDGGPIDPRFPPYEWEYKGKDPRYFGKKLKNGLLPSDMMGKVPEGPTIGKNRPKILLELIPSYQSLCTAFNAAFPGDKLGGWGYRTYQGQIKTKKKKPGLAATPGHSNHGWGRAVDVHYFKENGDRKSLVFGGTRYEWLRINGPTYGWKYPYWALKGGKGPDEAWHMESVGVNFIDPR